MAIRRIEPLMLNHKLAIVRINNLINRIDGDISSPSGNVTLTNLDGTVFIDSGVIELFAAEGNAGHQVRIKSTGGTVDVVPVGNDSIEGVKKVSIFANDSIVLESDGENWWVMSNYTATRDDEIVELLTKLVTLNSIGVQHLQIINNDEINEDEVDHDHN
jgi:hypothetical protein